ncbi:pistil-specific extensin-like protein [Impatiens glandulifera]|uniref:pistil-specific extensin-like protein n=1 Tax=Impatiens glandulifera TaxID=253017 RepID=UPI001FB0B9E3|nr:pistil-specific extensin-like protein [Impatiens glandulifera]
MTKIMMTAAWMVMLGCTMISLCQASFYQEAEVLHVTGKVLCQDCTQSYNEWAKGGKPIKGAKVSITCMDDRSRVIYYGSDATDGVGAYDLTLNKFVNGKKLNLKNCFARLVSSSDEVCNIPTDFNGGKSGIKLGRPSAVYRGSVKHVLKPFYYTTPMCDEPDTTHGKDDHEDS